MTPTTTNAVERVERTVGFVDLTGFTALTAAHGDAVAIDTVERFVRLAQHALRSGDQLVKTIGDAVMLSFPDPVAGISAVARLFHDSASENYLPQLRAGLHHGPVITRHNDVFGATVNLAARVSAQATSGRLLATSTVAATARTEGLNVNELGPCKLHNVAEPVPLYEIGIDSDLTLRHIDPVCHMTLPNPHTAEQVQYAGRRYHFCSTHCANLFTADPSRYLDRTSSPSATLGIPGVEARPSEPGYRPHP